MTQAIILERHGHVAEICINRPDKANAINQDVFDGLAAMGAQINADPTIRAVVLRGAGDNFCAGIDMAFLQSALSIETFRDKAFNLPDGQIANMFQAPSIVWRDIAVPVICALQGVAFGGGCQIALGADMRIAAPDTRLSVMEIKWGIIPDMGILTSLPRLVRIDVAKELVLTGRIVDAAEAASLGLVTRVADDPFDAAMTIAQTIASKNPGAVRAGKRLLDQGWTLEPAQALRLEAELQAGVIGTPNQMEAVMANFQKRAPNFKDDSA